MKKIIWIFIILIILAFFAICLQTFGQNSSPCRCNLLLSDRLIEAKWNPTLMIEIGQRIKIGTLVNQLKNEKTKRNWFVKADTTPNGNLYVIGINIKKNDVKSFEFYLREGKRNTSLYYNPKKQGIFIFEFSYKKPYNYTEFEEWKFWDFKETFPDEAYYSTLNLWFKPKVVWVKIHEIGIIPLSVTREINSLIIN